MEIPPYLPITSDYGFKATFGNPHNTEFLRRALPALIGSNVPIREVTLEPTTYVGLTSESRGVIFDLSCVDEHGRHFIVEMQVAHAPHFVQRLKFYAFQKLNALVLKGNYNWGSLPPIYVVALLSQPLLPGPDYHTVANLRTQSGALLDAQLTFVLVELAKFQRPAQIETDLEKLLFTMKTLEDPLQALAERPDFWEESWLQAALQELSTRNMSPEEYGRWQIDLARRSAVLQIEQKWEDQEVALAAAQRQLDEMSRQADAMKQQATAAQQQAAAAQQQAAAAQQLAVAAEQQAAVAERQAAAAEQQAAAAEQQAAAALQEKQAAQQATIRNLLATGRFSVEEIAALCNTTAEEVRRQVP